MILEVIGMHTTRLPHDGVKNLHYAIENDGIHIIKNLHDKMVGHDEKNTTVKNLHVKMRIVIHHLHDVKIAFHVVKIIFHEVKIAFHDERKVAIIKTNITPLLVIPLAILDYVMIHELITLPS